MSFSNLEYYIVGETLYSYLVINFEDVMDVVDGLVLECKLDYVRRTPISP
jgi:hypothetical protein